MMDDGPCVAGQVGSYISRRPGNSTKPSSLFWERKANGGGGLCLLSHAPLAAGQGEA